MGADFPSAPLTVETGTVFAEPLPARAPSPVLGFNVVAGVAFGIVMMDISFDRVPRTYSRHVGYLLSSVVMKHCIIQFAYCQQDTLQ